MSSVQSSPSAAMLTDLYELTMAYGYWKSGMADAEAVFHLSFRENPFDGGFAVACGLGSVLESLEGFGFHDQDVQYLSSLEGNDGEPLFSQEFLRYLRELKLACDIDAVPEGSVVFGYEPLVRVKGPLLHCQIIETLLLNLINYQTLVATKAARVAMAAKGDPVMEFGLRRAQGINGGLAASRAAYLGGCSATSNVLAGQLYGIPVGGTLAHSWVMAFDTEIEAFETYAEALPNNVTLLVDTYDSLEGVRRAVAIGRALRERGHRLAGIRLDSGDLAWLSIQARKILDEGGFPEAAITASNEFDEYVIESLKQQGATIQVWGVGTRLVTGWSQPALGGVYKLSAVRAPGTDWKYRIKLSEQSAKISTPGLLQVRRFRRGSEYVGDMVWTESLPPGPRPTMIDPLDPTRQKTFSQKETSEDLLIPIMRGGAIVYDRPPLIESRSFVQEQLGGFHEGIKRFLHPHEYPVGLEQRLQELKTDLILQARSSKGTETEVNDEQVGTRAGGHTE
ncbi:MAG: nicotinate phosphoribosyltransferase [Acidobacteria bacterium]|nr:nicotinate phosphoribosyltransferase [Acidobacteriota bacterium]